jgi:YidC/Oxa1 family membrane protein insertase
VLFTALYLLSHFALRQFFPQWFGPESAEVGIFLEMQDPTVKGDHHPLVELRNKTENALEFSDRCPMPPFDVEYKSGGEWTKLETTETALLCPPFQRVEPGQVVTVDLAPWKYSLFSEYGEYRLTLPIVDELPSTPETVSVEFSTSPVGVVTQTFRAFVTKPLLNLLIFIASLVPEHDLGVSIIILTVFIKLLLFIPTQHGLEGQRRMQAVQPKLDEIKQKYKGDPQKLQAETMRVWKEHKINPLQSCLPLLIQFPILIGLFFVIRDGWHLELSRHLIYSWNQTLPWTFDTHFLGLNLLDPHAYIFPPLLVVMQFVQMKLSFAIAKRKKDKKESADGKEKTLEKAEKKPLSQQEIQQKMMLYGLPLMIGFFALQFPAAVSLYWGISTLFGIGQQLVVNRKEL